MPLCAISAKGMTKEGSYGAWPARRNDTACHVLNVGVFSLLSNISTIFVSCC